MSEWTSALPDGCGGGLMSGGTDRRVRVWAMDGWTDGWTGGWTDR